ncbi:MAG: hypothetical protein ACI8RU_002232, partial [Zhongshania aliphaticivorans]
ACVFGRDFSPFNLVLSVFLYVTAVKCWALRGYDD